MFQKQFWVEYCKTTYYHPTLTVSMVVGSFLLYLLWEIDEKMTSPAYKYYRLDSSFDV